MGLLDIWVAPAEVVAFNQGGGERNHGRRVGAAFRAISGAINYKAPATLAIETDVHKSRFYRTQVCGVLHDDGLNCPVRLPAILSENIASAGQSQPTFEEPPSSGLHL
jgi:hypothetical protein